MEEEIWKDICGFEGRYQISNLGRIKSLKRKGSGCASVMKNGDQIRIPRFTKQVKYYLVDLHKNGDKKSFLVHRLVALTFIPNPENKPEVNHQDGDKLNNKAINLEWATAKENIDHAIKNNLINCKGENQVTSRFKNQDILMIRSLYKEGKTQESIGKIYNTRQGTISKIVRNYRWKHI